MNFNKFALRLYPELTVMHLVGSGNCKSSIAFKITINQIKKSKGAEIILVALPFNAVTVNENVIVEQQIFELM